MSGTKKIKHSGRFGARYGRSIKQRVNDIEAKQRGSHKCPECNKKRLKRISTGIFQCKSCNVKFAGKAYTLK